MSSTNSQTKRSHGDPSPLYGVITITANMSEADLKTLRPKSARTVILTDDRGRSHTYRADEVTDFVGINGTVQFHK